MLLTLEFLEIFLRAILLQSNQSRVNNTWMLLISSRSVVQKLNFKSQNFLAGEQRQTQMSSKDFDGYSALGQSISNLHTENFNRVKF